MFGFFLNHRRIALCLFDIICYIVVTLGCFLETLIDSSIEVQHAHFFTNAIVLAAMIFTFRSAFGFYKNVWRYTYTRAYLGAVIQDVCATVVSILLAYVVIGAIDHNNFKDFKMWQFVIMASVFCLVTLF